MAFRFIPNKEFDVIVKMSRVMVLLCVSLCGACSAEVGDAVDFEKPAGLGETTDFEEAQAAEDAFAAEEPEAEGQEATAQVSEALTRSVRFKGVNLASAEFGMDPEGWGAIGTHGKEYVYPIPSLAGGYDSASYYVKKKMNTFRLPFRWERLQPSRKRPFNTAELGRLRATVKHLTAKGAFVVIDPHNYARYTTQVIGSGVPIADFADFWGRLAAQFKGNKRVIFGIMNEPYDIPTEQWVRAANAAIVAIRKTGATNLVLVPGNAWTGAHSWTQDWYGTPNSKALLAIKDSRNNYAFEVHQYLDANFSGTSGNCPNATAPTQAMQEFTKWLRKYKKRGFLGEFSGGDSPVCLSALDNLLRHMEQNRDVYLGWTYWAGGPWWGNGLSLEPNGRTDKRQMDVLERYMK